MIYSKRVDERLAFWHRGDDLLADEYLQEV
jgi:hypothetical protein